MNDDDGTLLQFLLPSPRWRRILIVSGGYLVLWLAARYTADLLDAQDIVSLWHPPAGLLFCGLLIFGWRGLLLEWVAGLALLMLPAMDSMSASAPGPLYGLLYSLTVIPVAYAAVLLPLRRWLRNSWDFTRPGHVILVLAAALAVSALAALTDALGLVWFDLMPLAQWPDVFLSWLMGDFIGIIVLAPFLLVRVLPGLRHYLRFGSWRRRRQSTTVSGNSDHLALLLLALALFLAFAIPQSFNLNTQFTLIALLLLLPLAAVAICCGLRGAVLTTMVLGSGLALLIPLIEQGDEVLQFQWMMIAIALIGLALGGAVEVRNQVMARYRDFARVSNDLLWEMDGEGRIVEVSGRLAEHLAPAPGQSWLSLLGERVQPHRATLERALHQQQPFRHLEIALPGTGHVQRWIQINGQPLFDESGELRGYRGTAIDVSRQRRAEALLRNYNLDLRREVAEQTLALRQSNSELIAKERHLQVLLAAAPVGVLELDEAQRCRFLNANGCLLTGCSPEQALGRHVLEFVHPDDRDYVGFIWQINRRSDEVQWLEFRLNRTSLWCAAHWINLEHSDELPGGAIMVLTNATARLQQDERLWTLAHYDTLTNLPNRSLFWDRIGQALRHAKRLESGAAVLWLDLDGFKAINDTLGHAAGDALLQQVAERLKNRIRESDTVARMGGDEFAVILPDIAEPERAMRVATELVASLAEPFSLPQGTAHISGSVGVALYPQHAETAETLTQCADMAMYTAKHAGKNQVHLWSGQ